MPRESFTFTRLSMLIGPAPHKPEELVEPPGIAPGSSSLITWAFIPIVRLPGPAQYRRDRRGKEGISVENELAQLDFLLVLGFALQGRQTFGLDGAVLEDVECPPDG